MSCTRKASFAIRHGSSSRAGMRSRRNAALLALALVALTAANYSGRLIDVVYAKGQFRDPAWVEFARWNALSQKCGAAGACAGCADGRELLRAPHRCRVRERPVSRSGMGRVRALECALAEMRRCWRLRWLR